MSGANPDHMHMPLVWQKVHDSAQRCLAYIIHYQWRNGCADAATKTKTLRVAKMTKIG